MKMGPVRFVALTAIGSAVWNALLIGAGITLGANWERVGGWIGTYSNGVLVVATIAAAVFLLLWAFRRRWG